MIYIALYDIHGYIECRLQKEKKVNNITLEVVRDTHYEYFRSMEIFGFFLLFSSSRNGCAGYFFSLRIK